MKNAFMIGLGLGFFAGAYILKHCPSVNQAYDSAETMVKEKIDECQDMIQRKKQQKAAQQQPQM